MRHIKTSVYRTGFTIVELLIVIVVIAILAVVTIIAFNGVVKQAENTQLLTAMDNYQKTFLAYHADTSDSPAWEIPNDGVTSVGPGPGHTGIIPGDIGASVLSFSYKGRCASGVYPSGNGFDEGECFRVESEILDGEYQGLRGRTSFIDTDYYGINARLVDAGYSVPTPVYTGDQRHEVTVTESGQTTRYVAKVRGVIQSPTDGAYIGGTDDMPYKTLQLQYLIFGDQSCGRGEKRLTGLNEAFTELQQGPDSAVPTPPATSQVTVCTLRVSFS